VALWLGALALIALLAAALAVALALESAPRVQPRGDLSHADVERAVALVRAQDPRRQPQRGPRVLALGERDINLLLNHVAHRWVGSAMAVTLERGFARVQASVAAPAGLWLNVQLEVAEEAGRPVLRALRLGHLPLPAALVQPLAAVLVPRHELGAEAMAALALVRRVSFFPGRLSVAYDWDGEAGRRMLASLVSEDEQQRLAAYHAALAALPVAQQPGATVPLGQLLPPLFALAAERSAGADDATAAAENRAALLTLTLHATQRSLAKLLPAARAWPYRPPQRLTLSGREDFALHFLISAVLAADTTSPLSKAVGIYKEVADARGGSGFSFNDIAADRAGTRLGELALAQPRALQARLARPAAAGGTDAARGAPMLDEAALMPPWEDLPEYLPEPEFVRRFGGVGAPEYQRLLAEIDRRIAALPLLR
jgi:hypothetical protein